MSFSINSIITTAGDRPHLDRSLVKVDFISGTKVKPYFDALNLNQEQRDTLNISLHSLQQEHQPDAKRVLNHHSQRKSKSRTKIVSLLTELDKEMKGNLSLLHNIKLAAHDDTAVLVDVAFAIEKQVGDFFNTIPLILEMLSRLTNPPATKTSYEVKASDYLSTQQLIGRELPKLYEKITGKKFAVSRSNNQANLTGGVQFVHKSAAALNISDMKAETIVLHWKKEQRPTRVVTRKST